MSIQALQDFVYVTKYARYRPDLGRRETFEESVDRVIEMHKTKYEGKDIGEELEFCREAMKEKLVLGSQRSLQFGGAPILNKEIRIFNCTVSYCDRPRFFQECLWLLLCGCGTGFSVQTHHIAKLPDICAPNPHKHRLYQIPDTIEGWADSLGVLLATYGITAPEFEDWKGVTVEFDYSFIRPEGAPLSSGSGKAPGSKPLIVALDKIRDLLSRVSDTKNRLGTIDAYDIVMHASDAVLSGGVRRSACITLFSVDDQEMITAKTGDWFIKNPQRGRSNNSAMLLRNSTSFDTFNGIIKSTKECGEPGFLWTDSTEMLVNPCQPAEATVYTREGLKTFADIKDGSVIWSSEGWTTIARKWSTGIKKVYRYHTDYGEFLGTDNHPVVCKGEKVEVGKATHIQVLAKPDEDIIPFDAAITSIEFVGEQEVFDITVSNKSHTYWTGGLCVSNCVEIGLFPCIKHNEVYRDSNDESVISGWALCNLSTVNMKLCTTPEKFRRACIASAILGTLQAGYTKFEYLGPVSEAIAEKEALLGCSMTGMMDNPKIAFDPAIQREMATMIKEVNEKVASKIGINTCARSTCIKPEGSASCILGTSSGIHSHHAKRYFRRTQANRNEGPLHYYRLHNPRAVETSVWNPNGTDQVVTFPIEISDEALTKQSVSAMQQLEYVKLTQENWVAAGKNLDRCAAPFLTHNVSNTINIRDDEWEDVTRFIYDNRSSFAGISMLNSAGDLDYPQAPFCQVRTPEEILAIYGNGSLLASGLIVDGLKAFRDNLWAACDCVLGIGEDYSQDPEKVDWVRRAKKFADNYLDGDYRKTGYLLKEVSLWKSWCDLNREYQPVDWSLFYEDRDETKSVVLDAACSGGRCEVL